MKPVLLVLAVMAVCVVYEIERSSLAPAWYFSAASAAGEGPVRRDAETMLPRGMDSDGTGRIEREQSIRLFGPGVSRRQQIRV